MGVVHTRALNCNPIWKEKRVAFIAVQINVSDAPTYMMLRVDSKLIKNGDKGWSCPVPSCQSVLCYYFLFAVNSVVAHKRVY